MTATTPTPPLSTYHAARRRSNLQGTFLLLVILGVARATVAWPAAPGSVTRAIVTGTGYLLIATLVVCVYLLFSRPTAKYFEIAASTMTPCATKGCTREVFFDADLEKYVHTGDDPNNCVSDLGGTPSPATA